MQTYFITSTGTDIGKTLVTAALTWQLRQGGRQVSALKPVISGFQREEIPNDIERLLLANALAYNDENIKKTSLYRFKAPLSPDMAAGKEGKTIDYARLIEFSKNAGTDSEINFIEGIGGAMAPLTAKKTSLDWIEDVGAAAIIVVGSYLGSLSHTLSTLSTMRARDISIASVVISESADSEVSLQDTADSLKNFIDEKIIILPRINGQEEIWKKAPDLLLALG